MGRGRGSLGLHGVDGHRASSCATVIRMNVHVCVLFVTRHAILHVSNTANQQITRGVTSQRGDDGTNCRWHNPTTTDQHKPNEARRTTRTPGHAARVPWPYVPAPWGAAGAGDGASTRARLAGRLPSLARLAELRGVRAASSSSSAAAEAVAFWLCELRARLPTVAASMKKNRPRSRADRVSVGFAPLCTRRRNRCLQAGDEPQPRHSCECSGPRTHNCAQRSTDFRRCARWRRRRT